jgi:hypothetical protein
VVRKTYYSGLVPDYGCLNYFLKYSFWKARNIPVITAIDIAMGANPCMEDGSVFLGFIILC